MLSRRLSSKSQASIPKKVREAMGLQPGDCIGYEIGGGRVTIKKVDPADMAFHKTLAKTLDEWDTPEDEEAFRDL